MKAEMGRLLIRAAMSKAELYSNPNREQNYTKETFRLVRIVPLSDEVAWVYYEKRKGNLARCLFIWTNRGELNGKLINGWKGFFPSDSHMLGLRLAVEQQYGVEEGNFEIFHPGYKETEKDENTEGN